jgi:FimV-like protein
MRKTTLTGAISFSLLSLNIHALSVGSMQVDSYLGEPLNISIDLNSIDENEFSTLEVSLASRKMFKVAEIEYPHNAQNLHIELGPYNDGRAKISVKTTGSVSDPFVHLLLKISWSGGNILREYTALIDPIEYTAEPVAQAVAPETSVGITQPVSTQAESSEAIFRSVKKGDTLSAIAALFRPSDVTIQQAWMAFYNLNRDAFRDNNLNNIVKGANLQIPSDAQMRAMSQSNAVLSVRKLSKPLSAAQIKKPTTKELEQKLPTLIVGESGGTSQSSDQSAQAGQNASGTVDSQHLQLSDIKGYDQLASIVTELGNFTQVIKQEISNSRDRDVLFKEELIAARGENKVLNDRIERLGARLSRMSQLLELQSNALQSINANIESGQQAAAPGLALDKLESTDTNTDKSYYEQLLDEAISDAPEEDKSYIEEVINQSPTSIGLQDSNPVTPEMEAKAAASKPAGTASSGDQATETMFANVRASLGNTQNSTAGGSSDNATVNSNAEVKIANQDLTYIEALNDEDRSQIQKSEARIAELERELQEKIRAAQTTGLAGDIAASSEPKIVEPMTNDQAAMAPEDETDTGIISTIIDQTKSAFNSAGNMLSGVSTDIWRLIGGIGVAIIGLMVILGIRHRKEEAQTSENKEPLTVPFVDEGKQDVADLATKSMEQESKDVDLEEELHVSSLFDLSDESFMASEAIQDDNDDFDSLTDMDSAQIGQESTLTQAVDVDPIAEADVYLAYDRKEQAIEVLDQALSKNPNQSTVVIKLLGLYQASENTKGFTKLFESSAEHIEDDEDWNQIKQMAQEFVPGHEMLADDFDSSIPVLMDEVMTETVKKDTPDTNDALDIDEDEDTLNLSEDEFSDALADEPEPKPTLDLALAKAYIQLGETDIAKDFLFDVINAGGDKLKSEAEEMLASLG